jgi:uncharacterized protein
MAGGRPGARLPVGHSLYARAVLLDTGALLALRNQGDSHSANAVACLRQIGAHRLPVFISLPTIFETHRRFLFDLGRLVALSFLDDIYDGSVNIVQIEDGDRLGARALLERYADLNLTLVDAVNMAVMTRLRIGTAFSFDRHFLQAGFVRIPPFHL